MTGSDTTWLMELEHEVKLHRTEISITRTICGFTLKEK